MDPHSFFADLDPAVFLSADPDPAAFSMLIRIQIQLKNPCKKLPYVELSVGKKAKMIAQM